MLVIYVLCQHVLDQEILFKVALNTMTLTLTHTWPLVLFWFAEKFLWFLRFLFNSAGSHQASHLKFFHRWSDHECWLIDWLMFNVQQAIFQLYSGREHVYNKSICSRPNFNLTLPLFLLWSCVPWFAEKFQFFMFLFNNEGSHQASNLKFIHKGR